MLQLVKCDHLQFDLRKGVDNWLKLGHEDSLSFFELENEIAQCRYRQPKLVSSLVD